MTLELKIVGMEQVEARLDGSSKRLMGELGRAMNRIVIGLQAYVKEKKLSGQVLKRQTGTLSRSITGEVQTLSTGFVGKVGTNAGAVPYARIHEYGFQGAVNVRQHERTNRSGTTSTVRAHVREVNMPVRSYLRTSLMENRGMIRDEIEAAIARAVAQ